MNIRFEFRRDMYRRKRNVQKDSERAEIRQILNFGFTDSRKYGIMSLVLPCTDIIGQKTQACLQLAVLWYLYRADARSEMKRNRIELARQKRKADARSEMKRSEIELARQKREADARSEMKRNRIELARQKRDARRKIQ